ncbi:MAG: YndJ family transporter [Acidimicrobiales bacterium]
MWAPMVLAVAWAAAQHFDVPALSIPDMVRTHGAGNAIGFVGAGLLARRHAEPWWSAPPESPEQVEPRLAEVGAWS